MPVDYYANKSLKDLEELLARLQSAQATGRITEVTAAGVRTVKDFGKNPRIEVEIRRVLYSLHLRALDNGTPEIIAQYPDPYLQMVRRTRTRYTFS